MKKETKVDEAPEIIPSEDAKEVGHLMAKHNYTIEDVDKIMQLHKKHTNIPKKHELRMTPEDMVSNIASLMTPNQRYAYHELPSALHRVGR